MDIFAEHIKDLSRRSEAQGRFLFTPFLNIDEQNILMRLKKELCFFELFGGADGCERVMARFGSPEEFGYEEPFPVSCLEISPLNAKFADALSHRDYLGAVMNLGLERSQIGDIVIRGEKAFMFVSENKAEYICSELTKVKHTSLKCRQTDVALSGPLFETCPFSVVCSSERLDCIVGAVFKLPRSEAQELFECGKIFLNGRQIFSSSSRAAAGDAVSVRGKGKFIFRGVGGTTKKGRLVIDVEKFI